MKFLTLVGDPANIQAAVTEIHKHNPKFKITHLAAASHYIMPPQKGFIQPGQQNIPVPVNVLYISYEGPNLVDAAGKELQGQ